MVSDRADANAEVQLRHAEIEWKTRLAQNLEEREVDTRARCLETAATLVRGAVDDSVSIDVLLKAADWLYLGELHSVEPWAETLTAELNWPEQLFGLAREAVVPFQVGKATGPQLKPEAKAKIQAELDEVLGALRTRIESARQARQAQQVEPDTEEQVGEDEGAEIPEDGEAMIPRHNVPLWDTRH